MYCKHCGKELSENAVMCPNCGAPTDNVQEQPKNSAVQPTVLQERSDTRPATKIFMILGCVCLGFYFPVSLFWTIPMTVVYFRRLGQGIPIKTSFKVCSLLFVSLVAGILMLCNES